MNKKGFLFSFFLFIFSFLFIGNVKAVSINGVILDDNFFNRVWSEFLETSTRHQVDYPYVLCDMYTSGKNIQCYFFKDIPTYQDSSAYSILVKPVNWVVAKVNYNKDTNTFSNYSSTNIYIQKQSGRSATNFDVYNGSTKVWSKTIVYNPSSKHNITFHLNGGTAFDTSNPLSPVLHEEDYSLEMKGTDLYSYLESLNLMKNKATFLGWYYDANFTQPYNSSDTISSDIDLYAKFRSDIYNTNNIDYIEYKFDNIPLQENTISYNFNFQSVTYDGLDETIEFAQPFGREYYTGCDDEGQNCTTDIKYKDKLFYDLGHISYSYQFEDSITFNSDIEHISNSYSIIIPFEHSFASYVYLDFHSSSDYEMIIHYKNDEGSNNSYIETVDLTGKYGAIFLPKYDNSNYVDEDSFYLTNFKIVGNVDVQVTDSREMTDYNILQLYSMNYCNNTYLNQSLDSGFDLDSDEPINTNLNTDDGSIPYTCDNHSGIFTFRIDNLTANQTLRFLNHAYTEMSDSRVFVEYDTRYFNFGILDNPYSTVEIEDPTTHEIETVGLSEFYNQFNKQNIEGSKFTFKAAFNRFLSPIKFIFKHITKLFNNYLNESMQHYFYLAFCLMIVILLLKVIFQEVFYVFNCCF